MTEERLEQLVEGAASRFDRSMNRAWEHRPVRLMGGALSPAHRRRTHRQGRAPGSGGPCRDGQGMPGRRQPGPPGGGRPHPVPPPEMSIHSLGEKRQPAVLGRLALSVTGERRCLPRQAARRPLYRRVWRLLATMRATTPPPHHNEQAAVASGDGRVQHAPGEQHGGPIQGNQDHRPVFCCPGPCGP